MQKSGTAIMFYRYFLPRLNEKIDISYKFLMGSKHEIINSSLQGSSTGRPAQERVGFVVDRTNAATAVTIIATADAAGVRQI